MKYEYTIPIIPSGILQSLMLLERRSYVTKYQRGNKISVLRASSRNIGIMKHGLIENKIIIKSKNVTHYLRQKRMMVHKHADIVIGD